MTDYRKLYEQTYGITIPHDFDIHHIDFNHNNNDISNLVALPKELHNRLHTRYDYFMRARGNYTLDDIKIHSGYMTADVYFMSCLLDYLLVLAECVEYMNKRNLKAMEVFYGFSDRKE
jgi:hypothetical protein